MIARTWVRFGGLRSFFEGFFDRRQYPAAMSGSGTAVRGGVEARSRMRAVWTVESGGEGPAPCPEALDLGKAFCEHAGRLRAFLIRLGVPSRELDDLVSETFLIAHEQRGRFDGSRAILPWLFGIAFNVHRNHRRSAWLRRLLGFSTDHEASVHPGGDPEHGLLVAEECARVQRALAAMPAHKRGLLVLREFEGLKAAEIALALGIPEGSVHSGMHAARKDFLRRYRRLLVLEGAR